MLRQELDRMVHVPRFEEPGAAELSPGFQLGAVGSCDFAVLPTHG